MTKNKEPVTSVTLGGAAFSQDVYTSKRHHMDVAHRQYLFSWHARTPKNNPKLLLNFIPLLASTKRSIRSENKPENGRTVEPSWARYSKGSYSDHAQTLFLDAWITCESTTVSVVTEVSSQFFQSKDELNTLKPKLGGGA